MDLGTANSIIIHNDNIVVDEPSVVAIENKTDKLIASPHGEDCELEAQVVLPFPEDGGMYPFRVYGCGDTRCQGFERARRRQGCVYDL